MVCPKVNLGDIFFVATPGAPRSATNRISQKHVDYLVCDPRTLTPLFAVELDDRSHDRPDRQARDRLVDDVFATAHLPLVRVPVQHAYVISDLAARFAPFLPLPAPTEAAIPIVTPPAASACTTPLCPKCGVGMVRRTPRSEGGGPFWGCPCFPRCRQMVPLSAEPPREPAYQAV